MASQKTTLRDAFMTAYDAHAEAIFKHCYFRLFNRERAKEIMQDTFLRTWEQMSIKRVDIKNIRAFLYRIATNLIIDETRKKKTDSLDVLREHGFDPSETTEEAIFNRLDVEQVKDVLKTMDEKYREVIVMKYIDDLTVKEIAEVLDVSQNVISVRIHRGLKELKRLLSNTRI